jgi:hypothetical protein
MFCSTRHT